MAAFSRWNQPPPARWRTQLRIAVAQTTGPQRLLAVLLVITALLIVTATAALLAKRSSFTVGPAVNVVATPLAGAPSTAPVAPCPLKEHDAIRTARTKLAKSRTALLKAERRYEALRAAKAKKRVSAKLVRAAERKVKAAQSTVNKQLDTVLALEMKHATASR